MLEQFAVSSEQKLPKFFEIFLEAGKKKITPYLNKQRTVHQMKKYTPLKPSSRYTSPLFTHLYKFNGKDRTLNPEYLPQTDQNDLKLNPYARLLSSPSRIDRVSRYLAFPRDLLLKLSLLKDPNGRLWLVPNVSGLKSGAGGTYCYNNRDLLATLNSKSFAKVSGLELLSTVSNVTGIQDVSWNDTNWALVNKLYIEVLIGELENIKMKDEAGKFDLVIMLEPQEEKFQIKETNTIIAFSKYDIKSPNYAELKELLQNYRSTSLIIDARHTTFIDTFIKLISYNEKS